MRDTILVEFSDLLFHGETMGYGWNDLHEIMVNDEVVPMYECKVRDIELDECDPSVYGWSEDSCKVLKSFMKKNKIKGFSLV